MKTKTCKNKNCKKKFQPERQFQAVCSFECSIVYAKQLKEAREAKKKTEARKALREFKKSDKPTLLQLAQKLFNQYIRERDKNLPCISCGTTNNIQYHASHFKPAGGFSYLRFDENNVHKACVRCNSHLAGNLVPYRVALIEKIGIEEVERLEQPNQIKSWTVEELKEIIKIYRQKIKEFRE